MHGVYVLGQLDSEYEEVLHLEIVIGPSDVVADDAEFEHSKMIIGNGAGWQVEWLDSCLQGMTNISGV